MCKETGVKLEDIHRYDHVQKLVETGHEGKATTLRNKKVRTDITITNNKPDIIICDDKQGTFMLIDVAIPGDRNLVKKETEKILKYKELITEIHRMWNVKAKAVKVIIGATGTVSKSLRQYLSNISGEREIKELQNPDILATAHILRKVLM